MHARSLALGVAVVVVGLCALLWATQAVAEEEKVTVTGTVRVVEDDDGDITAVSIAAGNTTYSVTLDEVGKKLGGEMAGKKVEATGTATEKDDTKWLTVQTYKELKEEEE